MRLAHEFVAFESSGRPLDLTHERHAELLHQHDVSFREEVISLGDFRKDLSRELNLGCTGIGHLHVVPSK